MRLPAVLTDDDDSSALTLLRSYYGPGPSEPGFFTGSLFDTWDSTGTREQDQGRFTADDLVAVSFLSVNVPARAAEQLLVSDAAAFNLLLIEVDPDRDLAYLSEPLPVDGPEWRLDAMLKALPDVGPTTASKLFARKRPKLRPVYDSVVAEVLGTRERHWEPVRAALHADDQALHRRLLRLRDSASIPQQVSALRILDVLAWMQGAHPTSA